MKNISVVDNFIPEGAPQSESTNAGTNAIILGAGVQWLEAYIAADAKDRIIVGGSASVGTSGGYCLGGGYSPLSRRHGLCVDNVLQYKVVTADGELRVANAYQNQDLFWALRGGGPRFGIVVEAVYRTYPKFEKGVIYLTAHIFAISRKSRTKVIRAILGRQLQWSKEGWAGSVYVQRSLIVLIYFLADSTVDDVKASFESFMDEIRSIGAFILDTRYENHPTFLSAFRSFMPITRDGLTGIYRLVGSRLIQQSFFEDSRNMDALADTMSDIQDDVRDKNSGFLDQVVDISHGLTRGYLIDLTVGGQVANNDMDGTETSVTPAWRKALALILVVMDWQHNDSISPNEQYHLLMKNQQALTTSIERLRRLTPASGAYVNEADPNEPNWQHSFWGEENYKRLYEIKERVDPKGLFACRLCVGSEDWNEDLMCPK
ncbi:hypothetical protein BGW42_005182 [Actinomortierella wolfii]|nr:hypothetical protein BGW42_005182 [Actinomortierella wolfii]